MFCSVGEFFSGYYILSQSQTLLQCRRSATLRTYAGDTSLPGGKVDPVDRNIEDTAVRAASSQSCGHISHNIPQRREAFEEVRLSIMLSCYFSLLKPTFRSDFQEIVGRFPFYAF